MTEPELTTISLFGPLNPEVGDAHPTRADNRS